MGRGISGQCTRYREPPVTRHRLVKRHNLAACHTRFLYLLSANLYKHCQYLNNPLLIHLKNVRLLVLTRAHAVCVARATNRYCSYYGGVSTRLYRRDHW